MFLQEEKPVQSNEVLDHGLEEELETCQELKQMELSSMFSVAELHLSLDLVRVCRLQVVPGHNRDVEFFLITSPQPGEHCSTVALDILAYIGRQTSPLLLGQFDVKDVGGLLQAGPEPETVHVPPVVLLRLAQPAGEGLLEREGQTES